jgi:ATP-dependent DNA helicase DinG
MSRADDLEDVFGQSGLLAETLPDFTVRMEQLHMAESIARAVKSQSHLIVEAGTGVGKTFAYLAPILLAGKRAIISTGTRSLQDQLFSRDVPSLTAALGRPLRIALLKGRSNYLCLHRLQQSYEQASTRGFSRELSRSIQKVNLWSVQTRRGDIGELNTLAEDDPVWPYVTSTRENCIGTECPLFDRCWVMAARREAQAADVVVVNHHLLMADLLLKENGFGDLLPDAEAVVVDEAHQLPDVATQALGINLSARQIREWINDVMRGQRKLAGIGEAEIKLIQQLEQHINSAAQSLQNQNDLLEYAQWPDPLVDALHDSMDVLKTFIANTDKTADDQTELKALHDRAVEFVQRLRVFAEHQTEDGSVRWATSVKSGFVLHQALINVATPLQNLIRKQGAAWIFTSATLSVADDLSYFAQQIGLTDARMEQFGSPFDYQQQALLYLPDRMDVPSSPQHTRQVVEAALPVIECSQGGVFMLFTSYRALREAAQLLRAHWPDQLPFPLLVQGEAPRDQLLKAFRQHGNAILLGTQSFWEGVDVKGRALCVVVIDKLPFAVPDEPLTKARQAAIEQRGGNPFMEDQVPQAVVTLKQGVGRLIRDQHDFGIIMLCDRRLVTRSYGRLFLDSLPAMARTSQLAKVQSFLRAHLAQHDVTESSIENTGH